MVGRNAQAPLCKETIARPASRSEATSVTCPKALPPHIRVPAAVSLPMVGSGGRWPGLSWAAPAARVATPSRSALQSPPWRLNPDPSCTNATGSKACSARAAWAPSIIAFDQTLQLRVAVKENLNASPELRAPVPSRGLAACQPAPPEPASASPTTSCSKAGSTWSMDFIEGEDLHSRAQRQPPAVDEVLRWADALCDALAYLHIPTASGHPPRHQAGQRQASARRHTGPGRLRPGQGLRPVARPPPVPAA